jgi:hypothetical protein
MGEEGGSDGWREGEEAVYFTLGVEEFGTSGGEALVTDGSYGKDGQ